MLIHTQHVIVLIVTAHPKATQLSGIGPCSDQCLKLHVPVTSAVARCQCVASHTSQGGTVKVRWDLVVISV